MAYYQRENAELANLSSCELMESGFNVQPDYGCSLALDYFTEISEHLLPPHEPNDKFFRLLNAMIGHLRSGGPLWPSVDYFTLWAVRLTGVLPELRASREAVELVEKIFTTPLGALPTESWTKATLASVRKGLIRAVEQHVERRLLTVPLLEAL
jgi:DNA repair protein RecO (recombination protein O)